MADHPNASPTAARGVTGLPTLAEVEAQINEFLIANSDSVVAHHDGTESEESLEQRRIALYPLRAKVKATLRTLLSAAEQGERDRERLDWLGYRLGECDAATSEDIFGDASWTDVRAAIDGARKEGR